MKRNMRFITVLLVFVTILSGCAAGNMTVALPNPESVVTPHLPVWHQSLRPSQEPGKGCGMESYRVVL